MRRPALLLFVLLISYGGSGCTSSKQNSIPGQEFERRADFLSKYGPQVIIEQRHYPTDPGDPCRTIRHTTYVVPVAAGVLVATYREEQLRLATWSPDRRGLRQMLEWQGTFVSLIDDGGKDAIPKQDD